MSIEIQLREQLHQELQRHQQALADAFQLMRDTQKVVEHEQTEVLGLQTKLAKFDSVFGTGPIVPPPVVLDPAPVETVPDPAPAVTRTEPATAPKAKKITREYLTQKINNSRAAVGRREVAEGKRPKIRDAMMQAMGDRVMNADAIHEFLKAKEWLPNSKDPRAYIAYLLSSVRDTFERVEGRGRGFYRVRATVPEVSIHGLPDEGHETTNGVIPTTDEILRDAGFLPAN